jgi:hypothetical protein
MDTNGKLAVGLVDFDGPTLLLIGDTAGLSSLADLFAMEAEITSARTERILFPTGGELHLHFGVEETQLVKAGSKVDWFISSADSKIYAELIRSVAESERPSHNYLDVSGNVEIEIIVSKDEYDPATVFTD